MCNCDMAVVLDRLGAREYRAEWMGGGIDAARDFTAYLGSGRIV